MWKFHQYLYNKQNITWPRGIQILSSRAESISHSTDTFTLEEKIRIPARPCNILYLSHVKYHDIFLRKDIMFTRKSLPGLSLVFI